MELEVFGIGAAGNKAAIKAIESGVISSEYIKLYPFCTLRSATPSTAQFVVIKGK